MKLLLVLVAVLAGVWLWRRGRLSDPRLKRRQAKAPPPPLEMVGCQWCALHVPSASAVQGKKGVYCCADHLHRAEP